MKAWIGPHALWVIMIGGAYWVIPIVLRVIIEARERDSRSETR